MKNDQKDCQCKRCGKCCLRFYEIQASQDDLNRWKEQGRKDILRYVRIFALNGSLILGEEWDGRSVLGGDLWFNPETCEDLPRCPFLRKVKNKNEYRCLINDTKPDVCREYSCENENNLDNDNH